jgi:hypothetical protein
LILAFAWQTRGFPQPFPLPVCQKTPDCHVACDTYDNPRAYMDSENQPFQVNPIL